jgi:hypothetical protein
MHGGNVGTRRGKGGQGHTMPIFPYLISGDDWVAGNFLINTCRVCDDALWQNHWYTWLHCRRSGVAQWLAPSRCGQKMRDSSSRGPTRRRCWEVKGPNQADASAGWF